jgi:hypothetical protein
MSYMMQNFMQKGVGSFMDPGGGVGAQRTPHSLSWRGINNDPRHPSVQQIKQNCGLQDDNPARVYTQQATGMLRDHANNDPQGLSSLFGSFGGGGSQQQDGGGVDNLVGGLLGGSASSSGDSNQDSRQQQQQKKKGGGGGLDDILGM